MPSEIRLSEPAARIGARLAGDDAVVTGIAPIESAGPGQVTFLAKPPEAVRRARLIEPVSPTPSRYDSLAWRYPPRRTEGEVEEAGLAAGDWLEARPTWRAPVRIAERRIDLMGAWARVALLFIHWDS